MDVRRHKTHRPETIGRRQEDEAGASKCAEPLPHFHDHPRNLSVRRTTVANSEDSQVGGLISAVQPRLHGPLATRSVQVLAWEIWGEARP
eukprot:scaffold190160_cov26-Tisochrysis_lutea.AAC.2